MPKDIADRDVSLFLKGIEHAIGVAEKRPRGVSILRAMKKELRELSLRSELKSATP